MAPQEGRKQPREGGGKREEREEETLLPSFVFCFWVIFTFLKLTFPPLSPSPMKTIKK